MKNLSLLSILCLLFTASCGGDSTTETEDKSQFAIDEQLSGTPEIEDIDKLSMSFQKGEAQNAEAYFNGLVTETIKIDVRHKKIAVLDDQDASYDEISLAIDSVLSAITDSRMALILYTDKDWPLREEFHDLTFEWFASIEGLMTSYLYALADPMSRPDETWTEEELVLYEEYEEAYAEYTKVDERWLEFQYVYADKNNFDAGTPVDVSNLTAEESEL